jgi:hypothetical protein
VLHLAAADTMFSRASTAQGNSSPVVQISQILEMNHGEFLRENLH